MCFVCLSLALATRELSFLQRNFNLRLGNGIVGYLFLISKTVLPNIKGKTSQRLLDEKKNMNEGIGYIFIYFHHMYIIICDSKTLFIIFPMRLYRKFISHYCS